MNRRTAPLLLCAGACAWLCTLSRPAYAPPAGPPKVLECEVAPEGMACIAGGEFQRGADRGPSNARPSARVVLDTFYMDRTEVTVAAYDACVARGACVEARTVYEDFSRPRQPKVGVSWYHARDYCVAVGKHLPTEAEWEKAARGGDGRLYPWGDEKATCERAVIRDRRGRSCGVKKSGASRDTGRTFVVGSKPAGAYGLYDMSGNAWEWVADWYTPSYSRCGRACEGRNPTGPCGGAEPCPGPTQRVIRGGSWYWEAELATSVTRRSHVPKNQPYHHYGFRCAASVAEARALSPRKRSAK